MGKTAPNIFEKPLDHQLVKFSFFFQVSGLPGFAFLLHLSSKCLALVKRFLGFVFDCFGASYVFLVLFKVCVFGTMSCLLCFLDIDILSETQDP